MNYLDRKIRVLWLSNSSSLYKSPNDLHYNGEGWVASLQRTLSSDDIELGVAFLHNDDGIKTVQDSVSYYPIKLANRNIFKKFIDNWRLKENAENIFDKVDSIVSDFKPDIIHIFGVETVFASYLLKTEIPVVFHLQGFLNSIIPVYFPPGISSNNFLCSRKYFFNNLKANSPYFQYKKLLKAAKREKVVLENLKYVMGRTSWDRNIVSSYNKNVQYYHINEVLRDDFYSKKSVQNFDSNNKTIFTSVISDNIYKGLDFILKFSNFLESRGFKYNWKVIGISRQNQYLNFLIKKNNIEDNVLKNLNFEGVKKSCEISDILGKTHLYIHTSYIDNSSNAICEAQILGVPCISTHTGGASSIIKHRESGFLFPTNGFYELYEIIERLCNDAHLLNYIKQNGLEVAHIRHDKKVIKHRLLEIYNIILGNAKI